MKKKSILVLLLVFLSSGITISFANKSETTGRLSAAAPNVVIGGPSAIVYSPSESFTFTLFGLPSGATVNWRVNTSTLSLTSASNNTSSATIKFRDKGNTSFKDTLWCDVTSAGTRYTFSKVFSITPIEVEEGRWDGYRKISDLRTYTIVSLETVRIYGVLQMGRGSKIILKNGGSLTFCAGSHIITNDDNWKGIEIDLDPGSTFPNNFGLILKEEGSNMPRLAYGSPVGGESVYFSDNTAVDSKLFFWSSNKIAQNTTINTPRVITRSLYIEPGKTLTLNTGGTLYMAKATNIYIEGSDSPSLPGGKLLMNGGKIANRINEENHRWGHIEMDVSNNKHNPVFQSSADYNHIIEQSSHPYPIEVKGKANAPDGHFDNITLQLNKIELDGTIINIQNVQFKDNAGYLKQINNGGSNVSRNIPSIVANNASNFTLDRVDVEARLCLKLQACKNINTLEFMAYSPDIHDGLGIDVIGCEDLLFWSLNVYYYQIGLRVGSSKNCKINQSLFLGNKESLQIIGNSRNIEISEIDFWFDYILTNPQTAIKSTNTYDLLINNNIFRNNSGNKDDMAIYISNTSSIIRNSEIIGCNFIGYKSGPAVLLNGYHRNTMLKCNDFSQSSNTPIRITGGNFGDQQGLGTQGASGKPAGNVFVRLGGVIDNLSNPFTYYYRNVTNGVESVSGNHITATLTTGTPVCSTTLFTSPTLKNSVETDYFPTEDAGYWLSMAAEYLRENQLEDASEAIAQGRYLLQEDDRINERFADMLDMQLELAYSGCDTLTDSQLEILEGWKEEYGYDQAGIWADYMIETHYGRIFLIPVCPHYIPQDTDIVTDIPSFTDEDIFRISPNPSQERISITLGEKVCLEKGSKEIKVYNSAGLLVYSRELKEGETSLTTEKTFSPGLYICVLTTGNGQYKAIARVN